MRIKLVNFKCYLEKTIDLSDTGITLISGASGAGKTTIMQAIQWCLYGKLRNIHNHDADKQTNKKCSVTLYLANLIIYRQSKPKLLKITEMINGIEMAYEDLVAQQIIDARFGDRETWLASAYISQDNRALLLQGSNSERMTLLNRMAFNHDDPEECINRIDDEIKAQNTYFANLQSEYSVELALYQNNLNQNQEIFNYRLTDDEKKLKIQSFTEKSNEYQRLIGLRAEQNKYKADLALLESNQLTNKNKLIEIKSKDEMIKQELVNYQGIDYELKLTELKQEKETRELLYQHEIKQLNEEKNKIQLDYNETLSSLNNIKETERMINSHSLTLNNEYGLITKKESDIKTLIEQKKEELATLQNNFEVVKNGFDPELTNMNDEDYWKCQQSWTGYQTMITKCKELNLNYDKETIENEKIKVNQLLAEKMKMENESSIHEKINLLSVNLDPNLIIVDNIDQQIENEKQHYQTLLAGKDLLTCPYCNESVRYVSGKINKADVKPASPDDIQAAYERIKMLIDLKSKQTQQIEIKNQIANLQTLVTMPMTLSLNEIKNEIAQHKLRLNIINTITFIEMPKYQPDKIKAYLNYKKEKDKLDKFTFKEDEYILELKKINERRQHIITEFNLLKDKKEKLSDQSQLQLKLNQLQDKLKILDPNKLDFEHKQFIQQNLQKQLEMIQGKENKTRYLSLKVEIEKQISELEQIINLKENEINQLKNLIINDLEQQVNNLYNELLLIKNHLEQAEKCDAIYQQQRRLTEKRELIMTMHNKLTALNNFRQITIDLECELLQTTVNTINSLMNEILEQIFDMPILVTLKLYKKMKSNKRIKPSVNLVISFKGVEYDSINGLSGGEADRISLALVIAMNKIHLSPVLLLDEAMKSINDELRAATIRSLRKILLPHKTVVCINHEDTAGNYDHHYMIE